MSGRSVIALMALLAATALPVAAQVNRSTCSFNGRHEACAVNRWANGHGDIANIAVTWLSDGKQTFYAISTGRADIVEDNGRTTTGRWARTWTGFVINSARGNTTMIPW